MTFNCNCIFHIFSDKGEALSWGGGGSGRLGHGHQSSTFGFLKSSRFFHRRLSLVILLGHNLSIKIFFRVWFIRDILRERFLTARAFKNMFSYFQFTFKVKESLQLYFLIISEELNIEKDEELNIYSQVRVSDLKMNYFSFRFSYTIFHAFTYFSCLLQFSHQ